MLTVRGEDSPLLPSSRRNRPTSSSISFKKLALGTLLLGIACVAVIAVLSSSTDGGDSAIDTSDRITQLEAEVSNLRSKVRMGKEIERDLRNEIDYLYSNSSLFSSPAPAYVVGLRLYAMSLCGNFLYNVLDEVMEEIHEEYQEAAEQDTVCPSGYVAAECVEIDECAENMHECSIHASCTNTDGSYDCTCNTGYQGDGFECIDEDECTSGSHSCDQHGTCLNIEGSFECECDQGFSGDGYSCEDVNECLNDICALHATCHNLAPNYICECNSGYSGDGYNSCSDVDECSDSTPQHGCQDTAVCVNTAGSYECTCTDGFESDSNSCVDADECADGTHHCSENAECFNEAGTYTCTCHPGYYGDGELCEDLNECTEGTHDCSSSGQCTNVEGSYECECLTGYEGDGYICDDINECSAASDSSCDPAATCTNYAGGFYCECNDGFEGDGFVCSDIDECASGSSLCDSEGATCTNTVGGHECTCDIGYQGDGYVCAEIDECSTGIHNCADVATCFDTYGSFECSCPCERCISEAGYYFAEYDDNGVLGLPSGFAASDADACCYSCDSSDNCDGWSFDADQSICYLAYDTENKISSDAFVSGYINHECSYSGDGVVCDDVNECEEGTHTCYENLGEVCVNEYGGYVCECSNPDENGDCIPPVTQGPLVHYKFDEWEGEIVHDVSGYGYDGVTAGSVEWTKTDGVYYGGVHFDGMGTIVVPSEALEPAVETQEITVAVWVKGDEEQPLADTLFEARDSSSNRIVNAHVPWSNGDIYWDCGNHGSSYDRIRQNAAEDLYEGDWHHYAFTKNVATGEMKVFIDGAVWLTGSDKTLPITSAYTFRLGTNYNQGKDYHGQIDDFRIYKYALSAEQIQRYVIEDPSNSEAGPGYGEVLDLPAPVLHYTLDETDGLVVHDAAGSYDGTVVGGISPATGYYGSAFEFSAQGAVVIPTSAMDAIMESQQITMAMWVRGASNVDDTLLEGRDDAGNRVVNIHLPWGNEKVYWDCGNSGSSYDRIQSDVASEFYGEEWHHWAFTKTVETGVMEVFLDGEVFVYDTEHFLPVTEIETLRLGSSYKDNNKCYTGTVDDFRLYDSALSASQIASVMADHVNYDASTSAAVHAEPVLYYKLDQSSGTNVPDSSGNGFDGDTAGGMSWHPADGQYHGSIHNNADGTIVIPSESFTPVIDSEEITITMWLYGDEEQPLTNTVFEGRDEQENRVINAHVPWNNGKAYWDAGNSGDTYDRITQDLSEDIYKGGWHFYAFTKQVSSGVMSLFVDGECLVYGTKAYHGFGELADFRLGSAFNDAKEYMGSIDDFRMYGRALSQGDIKEIMASSPTLDSAAESSTTVTLPSPIVHYSFNEGDGTTVHEDASGYDGEVQGTYDYVAGVDGTAIHFSGDGNVYVPAEAVQPLDKFATVTAWIKGDDTQPLADTLFEGRDVNGNRVINAHTPWSDEKYYWDAGNSGSTYDRVADVVSADVYKNVWHFVSFVKDAEAGTMTIYVNGEALVFETNCHLEMSHAITEFRIASKYNDNKEYSGAIDEFTIYDQVLSTEQIQLAMSEYEGSY